MLRDSDRIEILPPLSFGTSLTVGAVSRTHTCKMCLLSNRLELVRGAPRASLNYGGPRRDGDSNKKQELEAQNLSQLVRMTYETYESSGIINPPSVQWCTYSCIPWQLTFRLFFVSRCIHVRTQRNERVSTLTGARSSLTMMVQPSRERSH